MQRVILFKGNFNYNVVNNFIDEIVGILTQKGFEVVAISITNDEEMTKQIFRAFEQKVYFTIGFNGLGSDLKIEGRSLFDVYDTTFIHWLVDHPALHFTRIEEPILKSIVVCIDETHCDYIEKYYPEKMTTFIEHGTALEKLQDEKCYDIVFAGGIEDLEEIKEQMQPLLQYLPTLLEDIVSYSETTNFNLDTFKEDYLLKNPLLQAIFEQNRVNVFAFINLVDQYYRSYKRQRLLLNILQQGFSVTYFGRLPVNSDLNGHPNLDVRGIIEYTQLTNVFCQSKIVVNIMPNFVRGGHERLFKAMACGAVVMTDRNEYITEQFEDDFIEMTMDCNDIEKLKSVLEHENYRRKLVNKNLQKIEQHHIWQDRVERLLQTVMVVEQHFIE